MNKTSEAYGDMKRDQQRDERIEQSHALIEDCIRCNANGIKAWYTSDMRHFSDKAKAIDYQYKLLRPLR